ncbi:predicted protein [Streptomyces sp. SPB78]|nr:predicted protein [Streptomyces sp. SPB78]
MRGGRILMPVVRALSGRGRPPPLRTRRRSARSRGAARTEEEPPE